MPSTSGGEAISGRKPAKKRLDVFLVDSGLAPSRTRAQSLIMGGAVFVDGQRADKAGTLVREDASVTVNDTTPKYVSRGGLKLEAALEAFGIDAEGVTALDVGASTGGFTDCLLQQGASKVYAVDVGYGQLDWKLRNDDRVVVMEKVNARRLTTEDIGETVDLAVIDVSFISLEKIIPAVSGVLKEGGTLAALIKPQFEVGKGEVGKGGVVRDEDKHREVVARITEFAKKAGFDVMGVIPSPILGAEGNKEFLIVCRSAGTASGNTNSGY